MSGALLVPRRTYSRSVSPYCPDGHSSSRLSSYSGCTTIDSVFEKLQAKNRELRDMMMNSLNDLDDNMVINQGTPDYWQPQLAFHAIHGSNVILQKNGRIAKRNESFCKGLAFSNRPIEVDEIVCLKLCEVSTNWSGVLRFGVTNVDPESYRYTIVPKFACPDLTCKEGYWAKALPERYSVEGNILHFFINPDGELYYGINGVTKGQFLLGINVTKPMWVIIDIYGNSKAVEFIDASEHGTRRSRQASVTPTMTPSLPTIVRQAPPPSQPAPQPNRNEYVGSSDSQNGSSNQETPAFHRVTGTHITLSMRRTVATRSEQEYSHGYVFTERPIKNNEKITIEVIRVLDLYHGGLAVGLTCRDPSTLQGVELPADSSDLVNFPEMFVSVKDVASKPPLNTRLAFWVTDKAEVKMQLNNQPARTLFFVDNSLQLYFYFDVYGSTQAIKLLGISPIAPRSRSPAHSQTASTSSSARHEVMPTHVALPRREHSSTRDVNAELSQMSLSSRDDAHSQHRAPPPPPVPSRRNTVIEDLLTGESNVSSPQSTLPPPIQPRSVIEHFSLFSEHPSGRRHSPSPTGSAASSARRSSPSPPPPHQHHLRTSLQGSHSSSPVPPPIGTIPTVPRRPPMPPPVLPWQRPSNTSTASGGSASFRQSPYLPMPSMPAPPRPPPVTAASASGATSTLQTAGSNADAKLDLNEADECTVCMAAETNSVIYTCGHMCMCYECALRTKALGTGCPICRQPMQDVIRIYRTGPA